MPGKSASAPVVRTAGRHPNDLVEEYIELVGKVASAWHRKAALAGADSPLLGYDDVWQAGAEGLVKASRSFNPDLGEFESYAISRIFNEIRDLARKADKLKRKDRERLKERRVDDPAAESLYQFLSLDAMSDNYPGLAEPEPEDRPDAEWVTALLARLPERQQMVLVMRYWQGLQQKRISQILGVTDSRVSQIESKALSHLRLMALDRAA